MRAQELREGDQRRFAVIGKGQMFGPEPLIGFVFGQLDFSRRQTGQAEQKEKCRQQITQTEPLRVADF